MKPHPPILRVAALSVALALSALLAGCGASSSSGSAASVQDTAGEQILSSEANSSQVESVLVPETQTDRKIIYRANLSLETTDFSAARQSLTQAVEDCGGYLESSDYGGSASDASRYAYYTVRVPVEQYEAFLNQAGTAGNLLSLQENAQDITANYIDVEARLTALEEQRNRLNALADQAETTADLLEIESQLSDVQYQIESYTQQLRSMSDQVSYSTVEVSLREVSSLTPETATFGDKVRAALQTGWQNFLLLLQGLVLLILYLLPLLVLAGIFIGVLVLTRPARKARRERRAQKRLEELGLHKPPHPLYQPAPPQDPPVQDSDSSDQTPQS